MKRVLLISILLMANFSIELKGSDELQRTLKAFRDDTFKEKVLTSTYRKAAKPFVAQARANAPVAKKIVKQGKHEVKPQTLKKSVGAWTYRKLKSPHLLMGAKHGRRSMKYDGWYYRFIEFGTVKQSAKPFLQPAWDATKTLAATIMDKEFTTILRKFKNKYGIK